MLAIGIGAFLVGCRSQIASLEIADSWFECNRRRDCTILEDPRCTLMPINRRYTDSFSAWVRRNRPEAVRDVPCVWNDVRYAPTCDSGRCSSNLIRRNFGDRDDSR
jgi:hypothetical protein